MLNPLIPRYITFASIVFLLCQTEGGTCREKKGTASQDTLTKPAIIDFIWIGLGTRP